MFEQFIFIIKLHPLTHVFTMQKMCITFWKKRERRLWIVFKCAGVESANIALWNLSGMLDGSFLDTQRLLELYPNLNLKEPQNTRLMSKRELTSLKNLLKKMIKLATRVQSSWLQRFTSRSTKIRWHITATPFPFDMTHSQLMKVKFCAVYWLFVSEPKIPRHLQSDVMTYNQFNHISSDFNSLRKWRSWHID